MTEARPRLSQAEVRALCERANARASYAGGLASIAGIKLRGSRGPCPLCGEGDARDDAFSIQRARGLWKCFRGASAECGRGGDAVRLEQLIRGGSAVEAACRILGETPPAADAPPETPAQAAERKRCERAYESQRQARARRAERAAELSEAYHARVIAELDASSVDGVDAAFVRAWLGEARALPLLLLPDALRNLRGVERAFHHEDFGAVHRLGGIEHRRPAMVAAIEDAETGELIGRHVTYLKEDGLAKSDLDPARKMWGRGRGGVWLTARDNACGPLFVGEGVETVLSCLAAWRRKYGARSGRALAVLSLANLQGGALRDKYGRIDPARPRADATRPAVTWAHAGDVFVCVDHDMKPVKAKVRKPAGGTAEITLDATARMEMCALLAAQAWRAAGATSVKVMRPDLGLDFNDMLRGI